MNMKIPYEVSINSADIMDLLDDLSELADQGAALGKQIKKITGTLCKFGLYTNEACCFTNSSSKIIPFPGTIDDGTKNRHPVIQKSLGLTPIMASPGIPLPEDIPDYRLMLQRDGLILLAWDKRFTETGERYTAYWVTSIGIPRFYASKPLCLADFTHARPDHKSYAAEDGIEFYGQEAPEYMVHVAPELMKSNPRHGELRSAHINNLKHQGNNANFNYKYLLKTEKKRALPTKKHDSGPHGRAS